MNAKTFVDTNVLVYAYDERDGYKQETAKRFCTTSDKNDLGP